MPETQFPGIKSSWQSVAWTTFSRFLAGLGVVAQIALTFGLLIGCWLLALPIAAALSGPEGIEAASAAALISLVAAALALAAGAMFRGPGSAMYGMLAGTSIRLLVCGLLGVAAHLAVPNMANAGVMLYLAAFYLVALLIETILTLAKVHPAPKAARTV